MTVSERNNKLKHFITCLKCGVSGKLCDDNCSTQYDAGTMGEIIENLEAISKILEQEPCEDAVSRADLLKIYENRFIELQKAHKKDMQLGVNWCINTLKDMPSTAPVACIAKVSFSKDDMQKLIDEKMKDIVVERKKGKWVNKSQKSGCGITFVASECTCCGKKTLFNCDELIYKYCPNCGAEMEGK